MRNDGGADPATDLLARLLRRADRRRSEERSVSEAPDYARLRTAAQETAFLRSLKRAEAAGAIEIVAGRYERSHLVDKVRLGDPDRLAAFLGVERLPMRAVRIAAQIRAFLPSVPWAYVLLDRAAARWARGEKAFGLAVSEEDDIDARFRIIAALARGEADGVDPRTFSARVFPLHPNDASKIVERQFGGLLPMLRAVIQGGLEEVGSDQAAAETVREGSGAEPVGEDTVGALPEAVSDSMSDDDVLERFGLLRFPAPVFLSGPVEIDLSVAGCDVRLPGSAVPFVAVQRDWLGGLRWSSEAVTPRMLTIENLTSFHRHVREVRQDNVCVVYTGGFPSMTVLALLRRLLACAPAPVGLWHWGDVDAGGARIAEYLEQSLGHFIRPHLMDRARVECLGRAGRTGPLATLAARSGAGAEIARVALETGLFLEQERVDPEPVG